MTAADLKSKHSEMTMKTLVATALVALSLLSGVVGAQAAGPSFLMEPARVLSVIGTGSLLPLTGPLKTIT